MEAPTRVMDAALKRGPPGDHDGASVMIPGITVTYPRGGRGARRLGRLGFR